MRISDWSSDVCSSDLIAIADDLGRADEGEVLRPVEHDLPLAAGIAQIQCLAGRKRADALLHRNGNRRKFIANSQHSHFSLGFHRWNKLDRKSTRLNSSH